MQFAEVVRTLEQAGSAQYRKTFARHGIKEPMYGVSYAVLRPLAKKLSGDQPLAEKLFATGNHDCRVLAVLIADPAKIKKSTLAAWAKSSGVRCLCGDFGKLVARSPHALELSAKWCAAKSEREQICGWGTVAALAMAEESNELDELFATSLDVIAAQIHSAPNFARDAMNCALIAVGGKTPSLKKRALEVAKQIGKVEVDHGDTCCQTPDAAAYIAKMWARKKKTGGKK